MICGVGEGGAVLLISGDCLVGLKEAGIVALRYRCVTLFDGVEVCAWFCECLSPDGKARRCLLAQERIRFDHGKGCEVVWLYTDASLSEGFGSIVERDVNGSGLKG